MSPPSNEDVGRLDVPMHDAAVMGGVECIGNFDCHLEQRNAAHRPSGYAVVESHAIQKLHGDEGLILVLPNFVNCANVGMA